VVTYSVGREAATSLNHRCLNNAKFSRDGQQGLIAKLEREAGHKMTLISAPAGFGKTTLLVEWLKGREDGDQSVAWVSLDEGDNDPVGSCLISLPRLGGPSERSSGRASWPRFARPGRRAWRRC
jgi:hypothetical protein